VASVFISYRRDDASAYAGWLYAGLTARLGPGQVFMDVDTLAPGARFAEVIRAKVGACDVLIALIGPRWLAASDASGARRLDDPDDFVALEIASALERGIRVVPLLVDGAQMPAEADLPERLQGLVAHQALATTHRDFQRRVGELVADLGSSMRGPRYQRWLRPWRERPAVASLGGIAAAAVVFVALARACGGGTDEPQLDQAALRAAGMLIDERTGLMWTRDDSYRDVTWTGAAEYCRGLELGDHHDWRLPSFDELKAIYEPSSTTGSFRKGREDYPIHTIDGFRLSIPWIWSSDKNDAGLALGYFFDNGRWMYYRLDDDGFQLRALCVRPSGR